MAMEILGAGLLGLVAILVLGGLLAFCGYFLPQLWRQGEAASRAKWGRGPGPFNHGEAAPAPEAERPGPGLPPREPLAGRLGTAPEDPFLAAAIALALTLYQQEQTRVPAAAAAPGAASPWALAGRWQAMQARLNRQKR